MLSGAGAVPASRGRAVVPTGALPPVPTGALPPVGGCARSSASTPNSACRPNLGTDGSALTAVSYLNFRNICNAFQGCSMLMTSSIENALLELGILLRLLILSGCSLNSPVCAGICFHFGFVEVRLSCRSSISFGVSLPLAHAFGPSEATWTHNWVLRISAEGTTLVLGFTFSQFVLLLGSVVFCVIHVHFSAPAVKLEPCSGLGLALKPGPSLLCTGPCSPLSCCPSSELAGLARRDWGELK